MTLPRWFEWTATEYDPSMLSYPIYGEGDEVVWLARATPDRSVLIFAASTAAEPPALPDDAQLWGYFKLARRPGETPEWHDIAEPADVPHRTAHEGMIL